MRRVPLVVSALTLFLSSCSTMPPETDVIPAYYGPYVIQPGDKLGITFARHEDISGEYDVLDNGEINLGLVGDVVAAGETIPALSSRIEIAARNRGIFSNPHVTIRIVEGTPVYVYGEVSNPGAYAWRPGMTLEKLLATTGGLTYRAKDNAIIKRDDNEFTATSSTKVFPGDIVKVQERFF